MTDEMESETVVEMIKRHNNLYAYLKDVGERPDSFIGRIQWKWMISIQALKIWFTGLSVEDIKNGDYELEY